MYCSQSAAITAVHFTLELDLDNSCFECQYPPPLRPTYAHATVCDYISDMLLRDPRLSAGCLYQDVVQEEHRRTAV